MKASMSETVKCEYSPIIGYYSCDEMQQDIKNGEKTIYTDVSNPKLNTHLAIT